MLWASGDGAAARAEWDRVPRDSPAWARARLYRGLERVFHLVGRDLQWREGVADLEAAASAPDPEGRLARAACALIRDDWTGLRAGLEGAAGWEAALLRASGEMVAPGGDLERALRDFDAALAEGIPFGWAFVDRGLVRRRLGDEEGALVDYARGIERDSRDPLPYLNRGAILAFRGQWDAAIADYDAALAVDPTCAEALDNRALARRARGDLAGALRDHDAALVANPKLVGAFVNRAVTRMDLHDFAGAIADATEALLLEPRHPSAWFNRGLAHRRAGDPHAAIRDWEEARRRYPPGSAKARDLERLLADARRDAGAGD
ncbi:MAG: tetratricopeptide repeat protein [Planctomycetales bacterium]|nr:tetratricopeptide repeat protein [Planctomycetales bacterium]